jgi:hypothetical protein
VEACEQVQQANVARALKQRLGGSKLRREIDAGAIERPAVAAGEIARREQAFRARHEIEVVGIPFEIEIRTAGVFGGDRGRQRRQIHSRHPRTPALASPRASTIGPALYIVNRLIGRGKETFNLNRTPASCTNSTSALRASRGTQSRSKEEPGEP